MINKDTEIYCSFAKKAGNTGCQMMNTAFYYYGLNKIYKSFSVDNIEDAVKAVRTLDIKGFLTNPPQNLKTLLPTYAVSTGTCQWENGCYGDWSPTGEYYEVCEDSGTWGCPELTWEADTCDEWKAGWDYTVGGLFPNMTQDKFFNDMVGGDIDPEDCEEILEANLFDF